MLRPARFDFIRPVKGVSAILGYTPKIIIIMKTSRILLLLIVASSAGLLSSCNTTAGAGRDIEKAGEGIHDTARRAQGY